jgi:hypothetical protein
MMPQIIEQISVFCDILQEHAQQGDVFPLEEITMNLTFDVIELLVL